MNRKIRIIDDSSLDEKYNMAADLFLLENMKNQDDVVLRIYRWVKGGITLGYMQSSNILDWEKVVEDNISVSKRVTGGRAVLHKNDISYSFVFPKRYDMFFGRNINETYNIIAGSLKKGLEYLGISTSLEDSRLSRETLIKEKKLPCFISANRNELKFSGKKLVGSAQKRTGYGVLQHGSIPVGNEYSELPDYQNCSDTEKRMQKKQLVEKCISINEIGAFIDPDDIGRHIINGFVDTLGFSSEDAAWKGWSAAEKKEIVGLCYGKLKVDQTT